MKIKYGEGTVHGPGIEIKLTGDEVATAILTFLTAKGVHISGPRTISVNGELCQDGQVYVDPMGAVYRKGKAWIGTGKKENKCTG